MARAAERLDCRLVFVVDPRTAYVQRLRPVLEALGDVFDLAKDDTFDLDALRALERRRPAGIVTFSETELAVAASLADALGLRYQSPADIPAITQKDEQRRRLAEHGIPVPRFAAIRSEGDLEAALATVPMPAIVKPVLGAASRNTSVAHDPQECRREVTRLLSGQLQEPEASLVLEELLVGKPVDEPWGDYIAVDCVAAASGVAPVFVTSKFALAPPFRERGGYGARSAEPRDVIDQVRELGCSAVKALGIHTGIADVEIKLTPDGPRVIEVNGRLGAWVDDLAVRSGAADPVDIALRVALGDPIEVKTDDDAYDARIAFNYVFVPPIDAEFVAAVDNSAVQRLRRQAGVDRVTVLQEVGAPVHWRTGAAGFAAFASGVVDELDDLARTITLLEQESPVSYV
jgi:biotin carboxylase